MLKSIKALVALSALVFTVGVYAATEIELEPALNDPDTSIRCSVARGIS